MDSRRGFFKQMVGEIARGVQEIAEIASPPRPPAPPPAPVDETPRAPPPEPALPTAHGASIEELLELADEVGLGARREQVRQLARASVRLTASTGGIPVAGESRLGGSPDLPPGTEWPHWRQLPLTFRLQLDLAAVAELLAGGGAETVALPDTGLLACFSSDDVPDGLRLDHAESCAVLLADAPAPGTEPAYGLPAALSRELTLPRTWAAPVVALKLDAGEQAQWTELRRELAALQGIEPTDEEQDREAPHRLLGYPDERRGAMPLTCALLAEGLDLGGVAPALHQRARELEPQAIHWRLLLQLTLDGDAGWAWGEHRERLYVWAHEDDLAAGDLSRVRAFVQ